MVREIQVTVVRGRPSALNISVEERF